MNFIYNIVYSVNLIHNLSIVFIKHFKMLSHWIVKTIPRGIGRVSFSIITTPQIRKSGSDRDKYDIYCPAGPRHHIFHIWGVALTSRGALGVFIKKLYSLVVSLLVVSAAWGEELAWDVCIIHTYWLACYNMTLELLPHVYRHIATTRDREMDLEFIHQIFVWPLACV